MGLSDLSIGTMAGARVEASNVGLASRWAQIALLLIAGLLTVPVWIDTLPAMPDYPAHLASFYLLSGGAKLPLLAHFYGVQWALVPNLAAELLVPPLAAGIGLGPATAVFLGATIALWALGAGTVQWALYRRVGPGALFAGLFAYNANFMWGFFNYCFAAGLTFVVFATWIARGQLKGILEIALFALAVLLVYFFHLFAAALLLLLIACYEAGGASASWHDALRRAAIVVPIATPAALAYVLFHPKGSGGTITFNLIDTILDKLGAPVQFAFDEPAWLLLVALVGLFAIGVWRQKIAVHPRMRLLLAVLLFGSIVAPEWALGGWGVDLRLPAVLGALAFASAEFRFAPRAQIAFVMAALLIAAWNAAALSGNWRYYDARFDEFRSAVREIKPGSKIVTVLDGDAIGLASDQPYWHMAEYAIIDRQAFTPLLFTTPGQHVIRLQPRVASIAAKSAQQGSPPDISELDDLAAGNRNDDKDIREVFPYLLRFQCNYDVALVVHLAGRRSPVPDMLRLVHAGSFFSLYRTVPDEHCEAR